jgi:transcriptional regulator with XRE-family HTH domain
MLTRKQLADLRTAEVAGSNRLDTAMKLAGVTQMQLSQAIGLTQSYISRIKNGHHDAGLPGETMRMFAEFFGCAIEDLFPRRAA